MKSFLLQTCCLLGGMMFFSACSNDDKSNGGDDDNDLEVKIEVESGSTTIKTCRVVQLTATTTQESISRVRWTIGDSLIGQTSSIPFISTQAAIYEVTAEVLTSSGKTCSGTITLNVKAPSKAYSPYITKVFEYVPAPGQFVNTMPKYEEGDTREVMNRKVLEAIGEDAGNVVTLGSFGGYLICGFDHVIANLPGNDFSIDGNCFAGSSEPGVVAVAYDRNKNGRPDADEWYELAGSAHHEGKILRKYSVTYQRPAEDHQPTVSDTDPFITDDTYLPWTDNQGANGYVYRNQFHNQEDYYPRWVTSSKLTFTGTRLDPNGVNQGTAEMPNWVLTAYEYGYADNVSNQQSLFDIDWAVDGEGNPVHLPGIDFIRIHTGVLQYCSWLGETSTEVGRITDLHLMKK